ncbi:MAG: alpha/beta fold hydrolase [Kiritimatiellia bacterium]|nr:alpha/beta fold hydrolase [Kiritimatiellia bacterium]
MPLTFDFPIEKLKGYQGINPKPADFETYWDRALIEMRSLDPQIRIEPDPDFQVPFADCAHLWFTGVGGARVHAKLIRPRKAARPHPAVLQFHGYSGSSGDWADKLAFAAAGFTVAALDCRGQGGLSEDVGGVKGTTMRGQIIRGLDDAPEKLLFRQIYLDTAQLAKLVLEMDDVDANRVGAMGGSQGGGLTLACVALEPRIRRAAPVFPFLSDYRRVWEMDQAKDAYFELREFFRRHDPQHLREAETFERLGYIDIQHLARRIRADVMMGVGLMDTICPPSTQFAVYNKIESTKRMELYPDFGHEGLPGFGDKTFQFMLGL